MHIFNYPLSNRKIDKPNGSMCDVFAVEDSSSELVVEIDAASWIKDVVFLFVGTSLTANLDNVLLMVLDTGIELLLIPSTSFRE